MARDFYKFLGIDRSADDRAIKKAYRRIAAANHPDRDPSSEAKARYAEAIRARDILLDPNRREQYDRILRASESGILDDWIQSAQAKASGIPNHVPVPPAPPFAPPKHGTPDPVDPWSRPFVPPGPGIDLEAIQPSTRVIAVESAEGELFRGSPKDLVEDVVREIVWLLKKRR